MGRRRTWLKLSATERQTRRRLFCRTADARDRTGLKPTGETSVADPTNREGPRAEGRQPDTRLTPPDRIASGHSPPRPPVAFSPASRSQLAPPGAIPTREFMPPQYGPRCLNLVRSFEIGVLRPQPCCRHLEFGLRTVLFDGSGDGSFARLRNRPRELGCTSQHPQSSRKPGAISFRALGAEFATQSLTVTVQLPRKTVHATPVPKGSRVTTKSVQRRLARPTSCPQAALALRGPLVGPRSRRLWTTLQPSHTESAPLYNPHTGCTCGAQEPRKILLSCSFPAGCVVYVL